MQILAASLFTPSLIASALLFLIAPLPNLVFHRVDVDPLESSALHDVGYFLTACLLVSAMAWPLVCLHASWTTGTAVLISVSGGILVYSAIVLYQYLFKSQEDAFF